MPSANLAAYLAKNYLTASTSRSPSQPESSDFQDSTRPKKKRRKNKDESVEGGLVIADDDEPLSLRGTASRGKLGEDEEDGDVPMFEAGVKSAEFRKKKGGGSWKVVATAASTTSLTSGNRDEDQEADRIIAEAAEESRLRRQEIEDEDAPTIVEEKDGGPRMQSGIRAGLQTAADTAALVEKEEREKQKELESLNSRTKSRKHKDRSVKEEETIYRDATGRRIDISLKRAEARAAAEEKARAERKAKEDAMGDVQRREREERRKELEEAKFLSLARGVDDEAMNDELRAKIRWDDPMAEYMAQQQAEEAATDRAVSTKNSGRVAVRKKVYTGPPAAPNRYGILPGWRWDGVDRSNGFEKEWFQARSKRGREEELRYQWQMDE
ncbi:Pre-mRNA-splicing factor cwc26 [Fonsecaea pedrosoi]|nr:Pre-mRNA-splicing factor cwc26 [Fonsecaea pedrosoi]